MGRKLHDRIEWKGLDISIENRKGSIRHWYDPHSKQHGKTLMRHAYGYIRGTEGADGDQIDCFVGPDLDTAKEVYIVRQMRKPEFKVYDEDKVMVGFADGKEASIAYLQHYDDPRHMGRVDCYDADKFAADVKAGKWAYGKKHADIVVKGGQVEIRRKMSYRVRPVRTLVYSEVPEAPMDFRTTIEKALTKAHGSDSMVLQTIIVPKSVAGNVGEAKALAKHRGHVTKVDETDESWRFRQRDPGEFREGTFRTIELGRGVKGVVGKLKSEHLNKGADVRDYIAKGL